MAGVRTRRSPRLIGNLRAQKTLYLFQRLSDVEVEASEMFLAGSGMLLAIQQVSMQTLQTIGASGTER